MVKAVIIFMDYINMSAFEKTHQNLSSQYYVILHIQILQSILFFFFVFEVHLRVLKSFLIADTSDLIIVSCE